MQLAHHVADDAARLHVAAIRSQAHLRHLVQDAALHRLQSVAGIRERARIDDRIGVFEERALHLGETSTSSMRSPGASAVGAIRNGGGRSSHKIAPMLPGPNDDRISLADVLPSCLAALGSGRQSARLCAREPGRGRARRRPRRRRASRPRRSRPHHVVSAAGASIDTVFPTTTAAALASLATGEPARPARAGRLLGARRRERPRREPAERLG